MHTAQNVIDFVGYGTATSSETAPTGTGPPTPCPSSATIRSTTTTTQRTTRRRPPPRPLMRATSSRSCTATDPADVTGYVGLPIDTFSLAATGGAPPYSWNVTGLPDGVTANAAGEVSGTPTEEGVFPVTATVTDDDDATDTVEFTITVNPELQPIPIAEIQGDGAVSDLVGDPVITEGVVTAAYPSGGFFGFYLQTEGTVGRSTRPPAPRPTASSSRQTFARAT